MASTPLVLYSANTWLAFQIAERYYRAQHYVWCTPYFDASNHASLTYTVPPSSSPAEICRGLRREIAGKERHSDKIKANKAGILRGAQAKLAEGAIEPGAVAEIADVVQAAEILDFAPLLYVIPYHLVTSKLATVPVGQRAHPLSVEFTIPALPRDCFDVLRMDGD